MKNLINPCVSLAALTRRSRQPASPSRLITSNNA